MARFSRLPVAQGLAATSIALGTVLVQATPALAVDWTGLTSTDWFNAGNWSGGVPTSATSATIDTTGHMAVIGTAGAQATAVKVGDANAGALTIQDGGTLSATQGTIGGQAGATGAVTVDGAGSTWSTSGSLDIGSHGTGTLSIRNGAAVTVGDTVWIGNWPGGIGGVTIDGAGSTFIIKNLYVGWDGQATLTISNGAKLISATVGSSLASTGVSAITVDGIGSSWTDGANIFIGDRGVGTLTIRNGATASGPNLILGHYASGNSTLNIGAGLGEAATAPGTLSVASVQLGVGTSQIVFNHTGTNYTFAPIIIGSGAGTRSVRVEAGTTILTAASSYTGPTLIDGGTLSVNGSIANSAVTVNAGGTLGGNGTVGSTMINGGALAPGNSVGLLTVNGSLTFTAAASYMVEISPAGADRVNVSGTATLAGATVSVSSAAGGYVAKQSTIVNAGGGITGTFGSVVNSGLPSGFKSSLSYDANNVYLDLALAYAAPSNTGFTINQTNVANALVNAFNSHGGIPLVYGGLTAPGLTQASGEIATAVRPTMVRALTQFTTAMTDVAAADRSRNQTTARDLADATDLANAYASVPLRGTVGETFGLKAQAAPHAPPFEARWRTWAAGFGGGQTTDGNGPVGSSTATSRMFGAAAGADHWLSPSTVAGFALAGGATSFNVAAGGTGRSDMFQAGAYIKHMAGPAYVGVAAAYGWHDVTTDRTLTISGIDQLRARFRASSFASRLEGGSRFDTPWFGGLDLTPYAAAQVTITRLPGYAEAVTAGANSFALSYLASTVTSPRTELGVRSGKSFTVNDALLTLRGRAAWARDFNPDTAAWASFQALPGASFVVNGAAGARDVALTTVSAEMNWRKGIALAATFEGEFSAVTRSYAGKSVASYRW